MAEIKSTLELILERTRNMTLSEEERREQATKEFREKVNGFLQKYLDELMDMDHLLQELERLPAPEQINRSAVAAEEAIKRLDPDKPTPRTIDLLMSVCPLSADDLTRILLGYKETVSIVSDRYRTELSQALKEKRNIWGSSVRVNLAADSRWTAEHAQAKEQVLRRLREAARCGT